MSQLGGRFVFSGNRYPGHRFYSRRIRLRAGVFTNGHAYFEIPCVNSGKRLIMQSAGIQSVLFRKSNQMGIYSAGV
jgi:hypothetical protein